MIVQEVEKAQPLMKALFSNLHRVAISGFFFLLPVFVILIVIAKAWSSFTSVGARVAGMFGMKSLAGVSGHTVFASLSVDSSLSRR